MNYKTEYQKQNLRTWTLLLTTLISNIFSAEHALQNYTNHTIKYDGTVILSTKAILWSHIDSLTPKQLQPNKFCSTICQNMLSNSKLMSTQPQICLTSTLAIRTQLWPPVVESVNPFAEKESSSLKKSSAVEDETFRMQKSSNRQRPDISKEISLLIDISQLFYSHANKFLQDHEGEPSK